MDIRKFSIPTKILGYLISLFGLLILAEPHFSIGIVADQFIGNSWEVNVIGMFLLTVGAIFVTGTPTVNDIWSKIEYGVPFTIFVVGFSLLYINTYGKGLFLENVMTYTLFGFITATLIVAIQTVYGED